MTFAEIAATVKVTAELMGARAPTEDALTVLVSRLKEHDDNVIRSTLRWMGDNETGAFTLKKLMATLASQASATDTARSGSSCCVNGCPMLASIYSDGAWHCGYHLRERTGPKADAITTALRRNVEKIDTACAMSNERGRAVYEAAQAIRPQIDADIAKEIESAKQRIEAYNSMKKEQGNALNVYAPLLKKWGVKAA